MNVIETHQLRKTFVAYTGGKGGKQRLPDVEAVKGIDLTVREGEIFAFLGPNGAGKSTTQRMLATLLPPTDGSASVVGHDLARQADQIRRCIGYVSQAGGSDIEATGRENLILQGRLFRQKRAVAQARAEALIRVFQLGDFADRPAKTYSGGQRRRLDIALALVHEPRLLFLDEPTTGLDPQSRAHLWGEIRRLRGNGLTVFLTTHYLEEADALADRVAIIDGGQIVAEGTPAALKAQIGGAGVTLDDVFLHYTGRSLRDTQIQ